MSVVIRAAALNDIEGIVDLVHRAGLMITEERLRRFFFDVPETESQSPIRGGVVIRDGDEIVGFSGLSPVCMYVHAKKIDGYVMGVLGLKPGYGAYLFDLIDFVREKVSGHFVLANTANEKASKIWTNYANFTPGPNGCSVIRYTFLPLGFLTWPFPQGGKRSLAFDDDAWKDFWLRCQRGDGGLLSRIPERMKRLFDNGFALKYLSMVTVRSPKGLEGYAILRRRKLMKGPVYRYEIIDILAVDNDEMVLNQLLTKSKSYAAWHGGVLLEYVGGIPALEHIVNHSLTRHRRALANTTFWFTDIPELKEFFQKGGGWVFGPYDGDRCLS